MIVVENHRLFDLEADHMTEKDMTSLKSCQEGSGIKGEEPVMCENGHR